MIINDNLFFQAVNCPLKLYHYQSVDHFRTDYMPFKHRNKLQLRNCIALQFENRKFTSDQTNTAHVETEQWLKEDIVTVCGAVLKTEKFITRIPILVKSGNSFTIVQIHGKLRKRSESGSINSVPKKRTTCNYLLKAAFRAEVLRRLYPEAHIHVDFYFPDRIYKATAENVLKLVSDSNSNKEEISKECSNLFTKVEATKGVKELSQIIPDIISHSAFSGKSVSDVCDEISNIDWSSGNLFNVKVNQSCKYCDYRKNDQLEDGGCWNTFFFEKEIKDPESHVFELIGHGNEIDSDKGFFYQEQVPFSDQFSTFDFISKHGGPTITIQQRRILQLLKAKGDPVPKLWIKPGMKRLKDLQFPLHFLDFEAATYAIPMQRGDGPYAPVYFQFSCHTMHENGKITHSEWLDSDFKSGHPHIDFIGKLSEIPDITRGTIVQYSQFEQRALSQILTGWNRNSMVYENEIQTLKRLIKGESQDDLRFLDLSQVVRDFYYNEFLEGGLGLKQILTAVLQIERQKTDRKVSRVKIHDLNIDFFGSKSGEDKPDPYKAIQMENYDKIDDGAVAMNAYISLKSNLLSERELSEVPTLLKRYCALDSYAMIVIYNHFINLLNNLNLKEDLILMNEKSAD